jgi:hypothetical protein
MCVHTRAHIIYLLSQRGTFSLLFTTEREIEIEIEIEREESEEKY